MTLDRKPFASEAAVAASHLTKEKEYWLNRLADCPAKTGFPCDPGISLPADDNQTETLGVLEFSIQGNCFDSLTRLMNNSFKRLHMILTAALAALLHKYSYSGTGDILIGTPVLKQEKEQEFINTVLPLRVQPQPALTFKDLLLEIRSLIAEATAHQNYPMDILIRQLEQTGHLDTSVVDTRFPLFDVALLLGNIHREKDIALTSPAILFCFDHRHDALSVKIKYRPQLYRNTTAERIGSHFRHMLDVALTNLDTPLAQLELLPPEEKKIILGEFMGHFTDFPQDSTIPQLFEQQAARTPGKIAAVYENQDLTYGELEERANRIAQFLLEETNLRPGACVGLLMEKSIVLPEALLGILKAGGAYVPIDPGFPYNLIKGLVMDAALEVVISQKAYIKTLNRLQWDCPALNAFLCIDSTDVFGEEEQEKSELMGKKLWEYVGEKAVDEVTGGGWLSSYTGQPIPKEEMDEYGDNILKKLTPFLHKEMRILEIGCASGISMYRLAPQVGFYYGTDLSSVIIEKNRQRIAEEGHTNIRLSCLPAHQIDTIDETGFDLIIINSVIQCFHGHNYLRNVLVKALDKLATNGLLFIGDIMDQDLKEALIHDLEQFKRTHRDKDYKTKTDWSVELFLSRGFFRDFQADHPMITDIQFSRKIYTLENELTRYRYDALFTIDKRNITLSKKATTQNSQKIKYQYDSRILAKKNTEPPALPLTSGHLAYVMYTSGSTGRPKGVMVEHRSVVRLVKNTDYLEFPQEDKLLQSGALAFDASTLEIWGSLLNGMTLYLLPKEKLLTPASLKQSIRDWGITTMWMTAPLFNRMLDEDIDIFQGLKNLLVGGDVLSPSHIQRLKKHYPRLKVINGYGPTENTTFSTTHLIEEEIDGPIPIGKPIANSTAIIVNSNGQLQPIGVPGELWVGGHGVSRGYLNNPEMTASKFSPAQPEDRSYLSYRSYKTGDLTAWLPDGSIRFLGRIDTQVKIRGYRIEVEEIQRRIKEIPGIDDAVVIHREADEKYLCAYYTAGGDIDSTDVRDQLSTHLPEYMVPEHLMQLDQIPLTPNGKVNHRKLPEPGTTRAAEGKILPENPLQARLADVWSYVLGREINSIGIDDDFFQSGGHSLKATILVSKIHEAFHVKMPLADVFRLTTIRQMAQFIEEKRETTQQHRVVEAIEKKEYYPLSSAQLRLYILNRLEPDSINYNIPQVMVLTGQLDTDLLTGIFRALMERHESLRTAFLEIDDQPVQRVLEPSEVEFRLEDHTGSRQTETVIRDFIRPFDLSVAPLFRVGIITETTQRHILMVDIHHIVADGTSLKIAIQEFTALYNRHTLPPLPIQYKDYSQWQQHQFAGVMKQQEDFWMSQYPGEIPVLNLPYDHERPQMQRFDGELLPFDFDEQETRDILRLARSEGVTPFMLLLAVFDILMAKLSGQTDIVVGTPVAGRRHADLQYIVGMFVNTVTIRNRPEPDKTFSQFLTGVKANTLAAFDNQEYPFEDLVDRVSVNRDTSRNPLFDVMFALHNMEVLKGFLPETKPTARDLQVSEYPYLYDISKFDLTFHGYQENDKLSFMVEYSTHLFNRETIQRFFKYFRKLIADIYSDPKVPIRHLELLDAEEKEAILEISTGQHLEVDETETLHSWFERQVTRTPDRIACVAVLPSQTDSGTAAGSQHSERITSLTFDHLNRRADALAATLIEKGVGPGDLVGLMVERSPELVISMLAVMKTGGAYLALEEQLPDKRKQYILEDGKVQLLLVNSHDTPTPGNGFIPSGVELIDVRHISLLPAGKANPSCPQAVGSDLVYVIYTSGSTGQPKGVRVDHRNMVNLLAHQFHSTNIDCSRILQFSTIIFDVAIHETFSALLSGGSIHMILSPMRSDISRLFRYIQNQQIRTVFMPMAFLKMIFSEPEYMAIFPRSIRHIQTAGEQVVVSERFNNYLKKHQIHLHNHYGPSETHVITTYTADPSGHIPELPPIGKPLVNTDIYILDANKQLLPMGVAGELCVAGLQVGSGYWGRQDLTDEKFIANPFADGIKSVLYLTGDLSRWLPDGNIQFLGRIDHQVKIRGFRIEMGEIENHLLNHPAIKEAVVKTVDMESNKGQKEKQLCAYLIAKEEIIGEHLREYLANDLPNYMVPAYFMFMEQMPLTASGKIDRKALPVPGIDSATPFSQQPFEAPANDIEIEVVRIWSQVLERPVDKISVLDNFFNLGGHSLKATIMISRIHKALDVNVPLAEIFKWPTIRELSSYIKRCAPEKFNPLEPVENRQYYCLSSAQKRLYFLSHLDNEGINYNMPMALTLQGRPDTAKLNRIVRQLVSRHESLRTSFELMDGNPMQRIHEPETIDISVSTHTGSVVSFVRPFDLNHAPLVRVGVREEGEQSHTLLVDMHHIICDGVSLDVLRNDFIALATGTPLQPDELTLQYKDFSQWQQTMLENPSSRIMQQQEYWLQQLAGELPVLELPYDFPRPRVQSFEGRTVSFDLGDDIQQSLRMLAKKENVTLYMCIMALWAQLLYRLSNQEDIIVGTPVAGRRHADLLGIIGMFVNTLPIRCQVKGELSFNELLEHLRSTILPAFENQEYPLEELLNHVDVERDTGHNPIFDVFFTLLDFSRNPEEIGLEENESGQDEYTVAKFDLTLVAADRGEDYPMVFSFEYCTRLFKESTIRRFIAYFKTLARQMTADPGLLLSQAELITPSEKQQLLEQFNDSRDVVPSDKTLHLMVEEQVLRTPHHVAVVDGTDGTYATYRELDRQAEYLAHGLQERGVTGGIVALVMETGLQMAISILAILKAGAAYLPIDPQYPRDRIQFILSDSNSTLLLDNRSYKSYMSHTPRSGVSKTPSTEPAYIIYTSGSTGRPKGVVVQHNTVATMLAGRRDIYRMGPANRALQLFSVAFDGFVAGFFTPLVTGASVVLLSKTDTIDPQKIKTAICNHRITHLISVPSLFRLLINCMNSNDLATLQAVTLAGETTDWQLIEQVRSKSSTLEIVNEYGVTESSVLSSYFRHQENAEVISIGKPIPGTAIHILNVSGHLQPVGVPGELYITGAGVARGYFNNPELTFTKFSQTETGDRSYKTGDLARWLPSGNLQYLGRIDHQVKIRGYRIETGEIETQLRRYPQVKEAVVAVKGKEHDHYLCGYVVWQQQPEKDETARLKQALRQSLPEYMVPSFILSVEALPMTVTGKIDLKALPEPSEKQPDRVIVAPETPIQKTLVRIWSEVLDLPPHQIGIHDHFFDLGGQSLKATILTATIHRDLDVKVPLVELFKYPTIHGLAQWIEAAPTVLYKSIVPVEKKEYYPQSSAQKRLFFLDRFENIGTSYNSPSVMKVEGNLDIDTLERTFRQLIERHETLRSSFSLIDDQAVQVVHEPDAIAATIEYFEPPVDEERIISGFIRPFNLAQAPLIRLGLISLEQGNYILLLDMHHIIGDGTSMGILIDDFIRLYQGREVPPLNVQYRDFASWQNRAVQDGRIDLQQQYWLERFKGEIPRLNLPTDFPRPDVISFEGNHYSFELSGETFQGLKRLLASLEVTLNMNLLAALNVLFHKYTAQEDIVIGTGIMGRPHPDLYDIIGMFVNSLALRNRPEPGKTYLSFLKEVKKNSIDAYENQDLQFEDLVDKLHADRDSSRNPMFDVLMVVQNYRQAKETFGTELSFSPYPFENNSSKFDLTLFATEMEESIAFTLEYSTRLFKPASIREIADNYLEILHQIVADGNKPLGEFTITNTLAKVNTDIKNEYDKEFNF